MRIVSLTCSNTEIVAALGCGDQLVGVDDYSDYPEELVAKLPRVGPDLGIRVEDVARLEPDLVLASLTVPGHEKVVESIDKAGLPYIAPAPTGIDDVYRDVRDIAARLGVVERGEVVVAEMQAALAPAPVSEDARPKILVEWWPKPVIVPAGQSWVTDLIERAGGVNPWGDVDRESVSVEPAEVERVAPDAVVLSWCGIEPHKVRASVARERDGWQNVPAIAHDRVVLIPEAYLGRPSPRLIEGCERLRRVVGQVHAARSQ